MVDRREQRGLAAEAPVDADRAHARCIREPERAHDQAVDADDAEQGATPDVTEGVEALLEESRRRERSAAREALHDLLVEQRVHRSEEHTSELQSLAYLVCRLLLEKKKKKRKER